MPTKFKTSEGLCRSFCGELRFLGLGGRRCYDVELWLLNDITNQNNWRFTNLEQHLSLFAGTPLLCAFVGNKVGDGHNYELRFDPDTGKEYASFIAPTAERIVGALSEDKAQFRLEERDGHTWIVGRGFLWSWYAP
ncbi:MAG: hypothetical protein RSA62_06595, partial [Oscillospiraceae bacterium]